MNRGIPILLALLAVACGDSFSDSTATGLWRLDHAESHGVLLSVWGTSEDDVWVAGGDADASLLLHGDGTHWEQIDVGEHSLLWYVYGFGGSDVYAVGEDGLILHFNGTSWQRAQVDTRSTLYGVWGAGPDDVWIVGGDPGGESGDAVVLRGHGTSFELVESIPSELLPESLFKVYGYDADDVVAVGSSGTVLRMSDGQWGLESVPTDAPLFSLWGRGRDDLYAVGGHERGELLHFDGGTWSRVRGETFSSALSGVFTAPNRSTIAVGDSGYIVEVMIDGTRVEPRMPRVDPTPSLHGVWGAPSGVVFAVGGNLNNPDHSMTGVIVKR